MPPRNLNVIFLACCISFLCYVTHRRAKTAIMVGNAYDLINTYYVDPVDEKSLMIAAMDGMTSTLDQHSEYIPAGLYESFQNSISQEFAGIGIYVEQPKKNEPVRVITPLVGSPALRAGMLPGDQIIKIDGQDVSRMDLSEVSDRLKGPINTVVSVVVRRDDEEPIAMSIQRATIELESIIGDHRDEENAWVYRLSDDPTIAYVRLTSFGEKTVDELRSVLTGLDNDYRGLIVDVRGNSGGLLFAAIEISDMFLDRGRIVSTRIRGDRIEDESDATPGTLVDLDRPVAVLIDENSASASEILAAALQDNARAVVVGKRSYGKGTVQNIFPLQYGRSALRLTVARYYRPNGKNIHRPKAAASENSRLPTPHDGGVEEIPATDEATKEAIEELEWGVSPNEGMVVEIDDATRRALMQRWQEASYPSLRGNDESAADGDEIPNLIEIDPQLRRAVEAIEDASSGISAAQPSATAA
ncbi:S41 family peptidase [Novipirellula artificiosorum]|uniref:Putative CtpA-like serine protease n=1 Tax=Novipirellula artificiosorum TaxID=2528016 RepID=A0A5C6E0R3_9BACT|nr:S41 family peptidase [Novipirellula artificiosorum]TWU40759.1 putative CtpA-like serine protease [Novipirellula artificiosorum]